MELLKKLFFSFCFVCCKFRNTDRMPDGVPTIDHVDSKQQNQNGSPAVLAVPKKKGSHSQTAEAAHNNGFQHY